MTVTFKDDRHREERRARNRDDLVLARASEGLSASTILWLLLLFDVLFIVVPTGHFMLGSPFPTIDQLFSLENEPTIPGWYSSVKLLAVAGLVAALSLSFRPGSWERLALLAAAFVFLVMSCDEAAAIHERTQRVIDNRLLTGVTDHIYDGEVLAKVVLGLIALAVAAVAVIVAVRLFRRIGKGRIAFGAGFLLLAAGAVGIDLTQEFLALDEGGAFLAVALEEACEMVGVTLMIFGGLQAIACAPVAVHLGARLSARALDPA